MKNRTKIFLVAWLTGASMVVFSFVFRSAFFYIPSNEVTLAYSSQQQNEKENYLALYPKQLLIPSIKVKSKITYVGLTSKGNMATPSNFTDVGWFKYGVLPGQNGSAVIAGHVNNGLDFPAVFGSLNKIKIGDDVYVDTIGGDHIHFVVTNIETYAFNAPAEEIFNQTNGKFLKLITCAGVWIDQYKTHNKRLVITAKQV